MMNINDQIIDNNILFRDIFYFFASVIVKMEAGV